jgi:hypothetical protein
VHACSHARKHTHHDKHLHFLIGGHAHHTYFYVCFRTHKHTKTLKPLFFPGLIRNQPWHCCTRHVPLSSGELTRLWDPCLFQARFEISITARGMCPFPAASSPRLWNPCRFQARFEISLALLNKTCHFQRQACLTSPTEISRFRDSKVLAF